MLRHRENKERLIWDGDDSGIFEQCYSYNCTMCGNNNQYRANNLADVSALQDDRLIKWMLENKLLWKNGHDYTIKSGVPAYVVPSVCDACRKSHYILIGLKEVQPQRYNIYQKSIIAIEPTGD